MNLQILVILIMLTGSLIFSILNWTTISAPGTVNIGVGMLDLPVGLILLFIVVLFAVLSVVVLILHQAGDRVGELHEYVEVHLGRIIEKIDAIENHIERIDLKKLIETEVEGIEDRIEQAEDELRGEIKRAR